MTWQPIKTAPNDTDILVYGTDDLCGWIEGIKMGIAKRKGDCWFNHGAEIITTPTHWMPLPEAPDEIERTDEREQ